jgi:hypothetical protein
LSIFSWQWQRQRRGTQSEAAERWLARRMPARGACMHRSCMHNVRSGTIEPPAHAHLSSRVTYGPSVHACCSRVCFEPQEYIMCINHGRTGAHISVVLCPRHRQCTCIFATVYTYPAVVVVMRVPLYMCTCAEYEILRARASTCQFAGRPPSCQPF